MSQLPTVSVIIPSFNSAAFVENSIRSVKKQSYQPIEMIVVDDGSTDNTVETLKSLQASLDFTFIEQSNQGPGSARNQGIKYAKGEYLCFLDADDQFLPQSIEKKIAVMQQHRAVDLIFTDVIRLDHQDKPGYAFLAEHQFLEKFKSAVETHTESLYIFNDQYFDCAILHFPFIWTSSVMVRRSVVDRVGYFQAHWRGSEDIDYWLRIAEQGKIAYLNEALTEWHHYYSNLTKFGHFDFYTDTLTCYRNIRAHLGEKQYLKKALNKRLAHYAFAGGYEALSMHAMKPARKFFYQSCGYYPLKLKYWIYAGLSTMPSWLFFPLRSVKQKLQQAT